MRTFSVEIPEDRIRDFCMRWKLRELALFGSVLGPQFTDASDVDVLVEFRDGVEWSLFDWIVMGDELRAIFGREVDLVAKEGLRNPYRRDAILESREVIYAA